jgi:hypothetical protein
MISMVSVADDMFMLVDDTLALRWSYLGIMLELLWSYVVVMLELCQSDVGVT